MKGETYTANEAPKGEFGVYLIADNLIDLIDVKLKHLDLLIYKR